MKQILIIVFILIIWLLISTKPEERPISVPKKYTKTTGLNFRSSQPDSLQMIAFAKYDSIKSVIRLNADGPISLEREAAIWDSLGVRMYYFNIEGNPKAAYDTIRPFLQSGNTLVHCLHGHDRTGVIMGLWMKENGFLTQEIIDANQWDNYVAKKGVAYRKYWDAVFKD